MANTSSVIHASSTSDSAVPGHTRPAQATLQSRPTHGAPPAPSAALSAGQNSPLPSTTLSPGRPGNLASNQGFNSNAQQRPTSTSNAHGQRSSPQGRFIQSPSLGNILSAIVLVLTVVSLGWVVGIGVVSLKIQKWTARNDAFEACLSWESTGHSSVYCNETIQAGVTRPPLLKRTLQGFMPGGEGIPSLAYRLALVVTVTLFLGIATLIYFRPRLEPFRPTISNVRTERTGTTFWRTTSKRFIAGGTERPWLTGQYLSLYGVDMCWRAVDEAGPVDSIKAHSEGTRVGIFYTTDSEEDNDDDECTGSDKHVNETSTKGMDECGIEYVDGIMQKHQAKSAESIDKLILQERHQYIMDWYQKQAVDDGALLTTSDSAHRGLRSVTMTHLLSLTANICRQISNTTSPAVGSEGWQSQKAPPLDCAYVLAVAREIAERTGSRGAGTNLEHGGRDKPVDTSALLSAWHACITEHGSEENDYESEIPSPSVSDAEDDRHSDYSPPATIVKARSNHILARIARKPIFGTGARRPAGLLKTGLATLRKGFARRRAQEEQGQVYPEVAWLYDPEDTGSIEFAEPP